MIKVVNLISIIRFLRLLSTSALLLLITYSVVQAAPSPNMPRQSDIASTKHNLSASTGPGSLKAVSESQICVFCHTPHGADAQATSLNLPLWNRSLSAESYIKYDSASIQANIDSNPGGSSKLCLSCHDGTLAIGSVNVLNGNPSATIDMTATIGASGSGDKSGFTRKIGVDLSNDHPISFSFDESQLAGIRLAAADGELRDPQNADGSHIRIPSSGDRPPIPLDHDGKVQCTSCHDPHISGIDQPSGTTLLDSNQSNAKFLRGRRFQMSDPLGGGYVQDTDIVCLACHDKGGNDWSNSVHANASDASESYKNPAADLREFPRGIKVWQAACMNCHDTHTVEGSRRLLREGTDDLSSPKQGGKSAVEETCYQCHSNLTESVLSSTSNAVPDIKTEFTTRTRRMPITNSAQGVTNEPHDIVDANFKEEKLSLGFSNLANRHAECTDCHNPHRILKNTRYDGAGSSSQATHDHGATTHSNTASGALTGTFGVEPIYGSDKRFGTPGARPVGFEEKTGMGVNRVTKEYQICLKCHSNYGYDDNGQPEDSSRPALGNGSDGLTPYTAASSGKHQHNSMLYYTNQAMEFQAPGTHADEPLSVGQDGGASSSYNTNNHRSWHPVMAQTGRSASERGVASNNWHAPFNSGVGTQTMYCTDCHGVGNGTTANSEPGSNLPWGPHGSNNDFILRGNMSRGIGQDPATKNDNGICFKCHSANAYGSDGTGSTGSSGFGSGKGCQNDGVSGACDKTPGSNGHTFHESTIERDMVCTWCHIAVPHGWKNKALLVNLNDIGPEAKCRSIDNTTYGISPSCTVGQPIAAGSRITRGVGGNNGYDNPPYYVNSRLRIKGFAKSGRWGEGHCVSKDEMINLCDRRAAGY